MHDIPQSVTAVLQQLADAKQQFTSVEEAWRDFLSYLKNRKGVDIHSVRKREELDAALKFIDEGNVRQRPEAQHDPDTTWFSEFERRADVLDAFRKFIERRGLTMPKFDPS